MKEQKEKKLKKIEQAKILFKENIDIFRCPICKQRLSLTERYSLVCKNNHCFDISKKDYVNLLNNHKKTIYDKSLFESRDMVHSSNIYNNLVKKIIHIINAHLTNKTGSYILDAGCGEGFYLNQLSMGNRLKCKCNFVGIDIAKEGISMATRFELDILWSISDLANLPFKDSKFDLILNILSPANYSEFMRVLNSDGIIIKVIPETNYLKEIRSNTKNEINKEKYSNENIVNMFRENVYVIHEERLNYKCNLDSITLSNLIDMTPLTSSLTKNQIDKLKKSNINEITIDLRILVGKYKK